MLNLCVIFDRKKQTRRRASHVAVVVGFSASSTCQGHGGAPAANRSRSNGVSSTDSGRSTRVSASIAIGHSAILQHQSNTYQGQVQQGQGQGQHRLLRTETLENNDRNHQDPPEYSTVVSSYTDLPPPPEYRTIAPPYNEPPPPYEEIAANP